MRTGIYPSKNDTCPGVTGPETAGIFKNRQLQNRNNTSPNPNQNSIVQQYVCIQNETYHQYVYIYEKDEFIIRRRIEKIPGIRNELFPVASVFGEQIYFSLERAAAPYFGIKAYGVHMNGYLEKNGKEFLWLGKRSEQKATYPGMLDHLVAGGLPHDISCGENLIKECEEEAGIPRSISHTARPVGAVSYIDIEGYRMKRDVLFCYDLTLPDSFIPHNEDGEVESFQLVPVTKVANIIRNTSFFKANCNLVITDFLFRHGHIRPEVFGYLKLLQSLRSGYCS